MRTIQVCFAIVMVVVTFAVFLPSIAGYGSVWDAAQSMSMAQVFLLLAVATWNILTFGPNWMVALPGLGFRQSLELNMASTAVANVVPAGGAVSFGVSWAMLREWGFERRAVALALILNGVGNNLVNVGYPLVAVVLLALTGQDNAVITQASFVGAGLFIAAIGALVAIMHSEKQAVRIGQLFDRVASAVLRLVRRGPVRGGGLALVRFREDSLALLRRRWLPLTIAIVVGTLSVFLVLVVALRVTGVDSDDVTVVEAFTAWSLVRLLTAIPITPGGVGITELVLVGTMTQFGGDEPAVVAAVLLFRALTLLPPIFIGAIVAFTWRRHARRAAST
jgi:uncharacterized protein (TIRG00374 family)